MVLTNIQIFTHMGFAPAATRNAIIADFMARGLDGLEHMSEDDVKDACTSYARRQDGVFPIILTQLQRYRLKGLVLWVKDMFRAGLPRSFDDAVDAAALNRKLEGAVKRYIVRKEQKKIGEAYLDHSFNTKLKSQAQYTKWEEELDSVLSLIVGVQGVPLTYTQRVDEAPFYDENLTYKEAIIRAVELQGPKFDIDARTVHNLILKNIHEDSDAYVYLKPLLNQQNGRRDWLALRECYSSNASKQVIINAAKSSLINLRYKNERSFKFETFSARLQTAYDDLERCERPVDNGDIVDALWPRIQATELTSYISSLKVDYQRNLRDYKEILLDIAAEVAKVMPKTVSFAQGTRNVSATYTREGTCPQSGVHTTDGSIFIGNYDGNKWISDTVKPYHKEIINARKEDGKSSGDSRATKRTISKVKRSKKKLKKLTSRISAAKAKVKALSQDKERSDDDKSTDTEGNKAGDSFGGKRSKRKGTS